MLIKYFKPQKYKMKERKCEKARERDFKETPNNNNHNQQQHHERT